MALTRSIKVDPSKLDPYKIIYKGIKMIGGSLAFNEEHGEEKAYETTDIKSFISIFNVINEVNLDTKIVSTLLDIKIYAINHQGKKVQNEACYVIEHIFEIENFEDFLIRQYDDGIAVDMLLGQTLIGIAYSTSRGIVYSRLQGSPFSDFVMPIIPPQELVLHSEMEFTTNTQ